MPTIVPPITTNNTDTTTLNKALNIKNNSIFSDLPKDDIIRNLEVIRDSYGDWIDRQRALGSGLSKIYSDAVDKIVEDQERTLLRIDKGINYLKTEPELFEVYKLANAVMLVNMVISAKKVNLIKNIDYFYSKSFENISYHLFQIVFLIINIESIVDKNSYDRLKSIDLIWFPTGGGKTEAYFLLSAFVMLYGRSAGDSTINWTSVIMRYTLRLLTSQQFERASRLILSLNYVCRNLKPQIVNNAPFSIGLWIGTATTPNRLTKGENSARGIIEKISNTYNYDDAARANTFPLTECPWCRNSLVKTGASGFYALSHKLEVKCLNKDCFFHNELPIDFIDESLYNNPPTLLFATIDKFAQLAWKEEARSFFGKSPESRPPDLIIQDELHLISGPLGSISALFEGIVEMLCSDKDHKPRIIASTATIKNASAQVKKLYGNRDLFTFPPPGIDYSDNFFSKTDTCNKNREYLGIYPSGKTFTTTQIKIHALILVARWKLFSEFPKEIDNYWTIVSYYNSLRELGRMYNKYRDEIQGSYSGMIKKRNPYSKHYNLSYPKELTSRIPGYMIKKFQRELENTNVNSSSFEDDIKKATDMVYATSMISVGIDIERLNIIIVNGQPKSVSEYIQVTSRIARKHPGLVISVFNPFKVRDRSHYENFTTFHNSYYRYVEPISVTPYTRVVISKVLATVLITYARIYQRIKSPEEIDDSFFKDFLHFMKNRMNDDDAFQFMEKQLKSHVDKLKRRLGREPNLTFKDLLISPTDLLDVEADLGDWVTMQSMREISPNSVIKVNTPLRRPQKSIYE